MWQSDTLWNANDSCFCEHHLATLITSSSNADSPRISRQDIGIPITSPRILPNGLFWTVSQPPPPLPQTIYFSKFVRLGNECMMSPIHFHYQTESLQCSIAGILNLSMFISVLASIFLCRLTCVIMTGLCYKSQHCLYKYKGICSCYS